MFRKIVSLVLFLMIFASTHFGLAQEEEINLIDTSFFGEVSRSDSWIPVLIELSDAPVVEYWFNQESYFLQDRDRELFSPNSSLLGEIILSETGEYQDLLSYKQKAVTDWMSAQGIKFIPRHNMILTLNAFSGDIRGVDLALLQKNNRILKIHDDRNEFMPMRNIMARTTGATKAWEGFSDEKLPQATGRNRLIGIIDTGLDQSHPEFTRTRKVRGGYNFADGNANFDDYQGHGTHVAGIAAGQGREHENRGMAYEADLMIYRVFTQGREGARGSDIFAAIDRSIVDKCDIINLSLGSTQEFPSIGATSYHKSIANADKAGVFVVSSAGNSGSRRPEIPWTSGPPAVIEEAFSVAATNDRTEEAILTIDQGKSTERSFIGVHVYPTARMDPSMLRQGVVDAGYGRTGDFDEIEARGKVALIKRGPIVDPITFREKVENATRNGCRGVILYNHTPGEVMTPSLLDPEKGESPSQIAHLVPTITLRLEDGTHLKTHLENLSSFHIRYQETTLIADFSSMGPTPDAAFKPEISAPGDNILSAWRGGRHQLAGGTSMSSPSVAGLAALLKEVRPRWNHDQVKSAFMNTADMLMNPENKMPITFLLQGAGSARIDKAVATPAFIHPRALLYSDVKDTIEQVFTITSARDSRQNFALSYEIFVHPGEVSPIGIVFDKNAFSLDPLKQEEVAVSIGFEKDLMLRNKYEGIIRLGSDLHIPMVFFRDDLNNVEQPLSNIYLSRDKIDLTFSAISAQEDLIIYFTLNTGLFLTGSVEGQSISIGRNYGSVIVSISDEFDEIWEQVAVLSNISPGTYAVRWNGKNRQDQLFLPRGKFNILITMDKRVIDNSRQWRSVEYFSTKKDFQVVESDVPSPLPAVFSSLKTYKEFQDFNVELNFGDLSQAEGLASSIATIEFELRYDPSKVMYRRYQLLGMLARNQRVIDFDIDDDDHEGWIKILIHFDDVLPDFFGDEPSIAFTFRTIGTGRAAFVGRNFRIKLSDGTNIRVRPVMPDVRITNRRFLHSDLNRDKIVDRLDYEIFARSFGSKYGEEQFDPRCDFNQDMKIDFYDLMIITREMGQYI